MKRVYVNITAHVMAVIIIFTSILSLPLSVSAQTTVTDDNGNNIIKVLDMALNKSGVSASPTTIQDLLDYMHDSVTAGAQAWSDLSDTAFNTVSDYVSACKDKVANTASNVPDSAKSLINGYLDYMGNCFDTRANFDAGYAKGENFRNYLMSYVTDTDNKSLNGAIAKNNKYNINSGLVNLVRQNMDVYIEEHEGYYLVPTFTYKDLTTDLFDTREKYLFWYDTMQTLGDDDVFHFNNYYSQLICLTNINLIGSIGKCSVSGASGTVYYPYFNEVYCYNNNWQSIKPFYVNFFTYGTIPDLSDTSIYAQSASYYVSSLFMDIRLNNQICTLFTKDGRLIKVWKSLDAFKAYTLGKSNIYYSNTYSSFDSSVDNSITFSGDYYMNNDYSYTTIQNNIDNSQETNETTINNIVNNYITNNYYGSDDNGGDGSGSGGGSGNWLTELITGIPQLLSALLDGITGLLEAGGELLEKIADLFTKLFVPSDGFADPIKIKMDEKFSFKSQSETNFMFIFDQLPTLGQTAPIFTFPFSKTRLSEYGVEDVTVSFDWFEPYRVGTHIVFSAVLWVMFAFNQYFAIKNIINASGSAVDIATHL